jgi:alginate O-acetyltransferase complex protein AlgI
LLQSVLYGLLFLLCAVVFSKVRSPKVRLTVLLLSSYALYLTWELWFGVVLLASTVMNFLIGKWLQRQPSGAALPTGIVLNLLLLGSFKYLPAVAVHFPLSSLQRFAHLALPLGVSFWTFQAMSYLFDLYRGEELDPTFFEFATYMVFFPVTISGPICRVPDMLPQFRSKETTSWNSMEHGVRRIATGIFMVQLAKLLGTGIVAGGGVNAGFDRITHWSGGDVWCLALGCGLQLFLDFAGYSHVAIGAAQVLGFTVPENFARPFQSTSASIFWTRWHMSLSFWIRDYIFLPLATLRREMWWRNLALVIAMVLFGLWHQATALFLLWGFYNGVLLILHRQVQQVQRKFSWEPPAALWTPLSWIATMAFMNLGWIFFRSGSVAQAGQMLLAIVSPASYFSHYLSGTLYLLVAGLAVGYAIALQVIDVLDRSTAEEEASQTGPRAGIVALLARWRWFWISPLYALALLILLIVTMTQGADTTQLMYRTF